MTEIPPPTSTAQRSRVKRAVALVLATAAGGLSYSAASARPPTDLVILKAPGPERLLIRAGTFRMGSEVEDVLAAQAECKAMAGEDCADDLFANELPPHDVALADFWIDRTEVTVAAYRRCVAAGVCVAQTHAGAQKWWANEQHPVVLVSWAEAQKYCRWVDGKLPTEAQWERAARGWSRRIYPWGDIYNPMITNHGRRALHPLDDSDGFAELAPVGQFPQGRTPEGVDDLAGNVEEWVADWYHPQYDEADAVDPQGPQAGDERVVRGGGFTAAGPWVRGATRTHLLPSLRRPWLGFRCAYDPAR